MSLSVYHGTNKRDFWWPQKKLLLLLIRLSKGYKTISPVFGPHQSTVRQTVYKWRKFKPIVSLPGSERPTKKTSRARCVTLTKGAVHGRAAKEKKHCSQKKEKKVTAYLQFSRGQVNRLKQICFVVGWGSMQLFGGNEKSSFWRKGNTKHCIPA